MVIAHISIWLLIFSLIAATTYLIGVEKGRNKNVLDSQAKEIAAMYLLRAKRELEYDIQEEYRSTQVSIWSAKHDIDCLDRAIVHFKPDYKGEEG